MILFFLSYNTAKNKRSSCYHFNLTGVSKWGAMISVQGFKFAPFDFCRLFGLFLVGLSPINSLASYLEFLSRQLSKKKLFAVPFNRQDLLINFPGVIVQRLITIDCFIALLCYRAILLLCCCTIVLLEGYGILQ